MEGSREAKQNTRDGAYQSPSQPQPQSKQLSCYAASCHLCGTIPWEAHGHSRPQDHGQGILPDYKPFLLVETSRLQGTKTQPKGSRSFIKVVGGGCLLLKTWLCRGLNNVTSSSPPHAFCYVITYLSLSVRTIPQTGFLNAEENVCWYPQNCMTITSDTNKENQLHYISVRILISTAWVLYQPLNQMLCQRHDFPWLSTLNYDLILIGNCEGE